MNQNMKVEKYAFKKQEFLNELASQMISHGQYKDVAKICEEKDIFAEVFEDYDIMMNEMEKGIKSTNSSGIREMRINNMNSFKKKCVKYRNQMYREMIYYDKTGQFPTSYKVKGEIVSREDLVFDIFDIIGDTSIDRYYFSNKLKDINEKNQKLKEENERLKEELERVSSKKKKIRANEKRLYKYCLKLKQKLKHALKKN